MGEGISAFVSAKSGATSITIFIRGPISPRCLEILKMLIRKWARDCGLTVDNVSVKLKKLKKLKKPKKKKKKKKK